MIVRLHSRASQIIVLGTVLIVTLTAAAQAATVQYVTPGEMHRFVVVTFLSGAGVVLGGLAVVFSMVSGARDKEMRSAIAANTAAVAALTELFHQHHLDADAHPAGSRARLDPLNKKLDVLSDKLTTLIAQHETIQEQEGGICAALKEARDGIGHRDPRVSPHPRRASDPPDFDGRLRRGRQ